MGINKAVAAGLVVLSLLGKPVFGQTAKDKDIVSGTQTELVGSLRQDSLKNAWPWKMSEKEYLRLSLTDMDTLIREFSDPKTFRDTINQCMEIKINRQRIKNGVSNNLTYFPKLAQTAEKYAKYMYEHNYLAHNDKEGLNSMDRVQKDTILFVKVGENIARNQETMSEVFFDWMSSHSGHKEAMLNSAYTHMGIGQYKGYWVLLLGKHP